MQFLVPMPLWVRISVFALLSTAIVFHGKLATYWIDVYSWHPWPGFFIAILALLGVLVPLLREHIGKREKALWTVVMLGLMILELRSLKLASGDFEIAVNLSFASLQSF